jgi:hypothetical protein
MSESISQRGIRLEAKGARKNIFPILPCALYPAPFINPQFEIINYWLLKLKCYSGAQHKTGILRLL